MRSTVRVLNSLADSNSKATLHRRMHIYRVNFRASKPMQAYLDRLEKIISIRR